MTDQEIKQIIALDGLTVQEKEFFESCGNTINQSFVTLIDYNDYLDSKNGVLIVYKRPIRNNGTIQVTAPYIIANWPKNMDEYLERYRQQIKITYNVDKIRRLDK